MSVARHVGLAAPFAVCLLLSLPALSAPPGHAPTKAERTAAREAYDKGTALFEKGNYAKALESFNKANAKIPSVQAMFWIAQSHDKLGHTEQAIRAYQELAAHPDFSKLSPDKQQTLNERLAALQPSVPPPEPAPVAPAPAPAPATSVEPPPESAAPAQAETRPLPLPSQPPALPHDELRPAPHTFELGVLGGVLFVSDSNNLVERGQQHPRFKTGVGQAGARAAYFPFTFLGVEAEYAHGFGVSKSQAPYSSAAAHFDVVRGHVIGQLPLPHVVPFALVGAGLLHGSSDPGGSDTDLLLQAGLGAKWIATELLVPRLDFRLNMTQKQGGGLGDGVALHPEVLLGLGFTLGR